MPLPKCYSFVTNRYMIAFQSFLGLLISVGYRTCFALVVTHISSTNGNHSLSHDNQSSDSIFPHCTTFNTSHDRRVDWTESTTFLFHTAFFAGQLVASFPAGMLASRFSPKWIFGTTILTTSVLFLILPEASKGHEAWVFIIRALQGIVEATAVPAMNAFISSVARRTERAKLINIAYAGAYLSPALAMFATGATTCYVSWDSMMYIYGAVGTAWSLIWLLIINNNPTQNNQNDERTRLLQPVAAPIRTQHSLRSMPWRRIFTSLPVIAIWVASFCRNVIFAMLITEVQQYLKDVYSHLSTASIGLFAAIPHILMALFMFPGSVIFDTLTKKEVMSLTKVRKLAQLLGYGVQGACFLAIGFVDDYKEAIILLCVGTAFSAFAISGFQTNPLDLAPQYAGALLGIVRTGMLGSVFSTVLASQLTKTSHSLADWQHMFIITGCIHLAGVVVYLCLASGELQPWAIEQPQAAPEPNGIVANASSINGISDQQDPIMPGSQGNIQGESDRYDLPEDSPQYDSIY